MFIERWITRGLPGDGPLQTLVVIKIFFTPVSFLPSYSCVYSMAESTMLRQRARQQKDAREAWNQKKNRLMLEASESYEDFLDELDLMKQYRADSVKVLNSVADEIDKRRLEVNIAKLVGASVGVLGAAVAATGVALVPFTGGISAAVGGVIGGIVLGLGTLTSAGAHITEKVLENVDLAEVQKVIDKDVEQCEKVQALWGEFEKNCNAVFDLVKFTDPSEEPDFCSLKTWVVTAVRETKSVVAVIAEALHAGYKELTGSAKRESNDGKSSDDKADMLWNALFTVAKAIAENPSELKSVASFVLINGFVAGGFIAFTQILTFGLGNLYVLVKTSVDVSKGSLSKVAADLREKSAQLEQELQFWEKALDYK